MSEPKGTHSRKLIYRTFRVVVLGSLLLAVLAILNALIGPIFYHSITYEWVRVEHTDYGFSFQYPEKWSYELYGDSGYHGYHEAKTVLSDNLFIGPTISIAIYPNGNPIADDVETWHAARWDDPGELTMVNISGNTAYRAKLLNESFSLIELIYFERTNDFILIRIDGKLKVVENSRADIEEFLKRFEPSGH